MRNHSYLAAAEPKPQKLHDSHVRPECNALLTTLAFQTVSSYHTHQLVCAVVCQELADDGDDELVRDGGSIMFTMMLPPLCSCRSLRLVRVFVTVTKTLSM